MDKSTRSASDINRVSISRRALLQAGAAAAVTAASPIRARSIDRYDVIVVGAHTRGVRRDPGRIAVVAGRILHARHGRTVDRLQSGLTMRKARMSVMNGGCGDSASTVMPIRS